VTYTQGPWTIESMSNDLNDGQAEVILANRKTIAWTSNTEVSPIDPMYERLNDDGLLDGSCGYTSDEDRANARLIAASPLMHEAITRFLYVLEKSDVCDFCTEDENNDHEQSCPVLSLYLALPRATGAEVEA